MAPLPEDLELALIRRRLDTQVIGGFLTRYERVASTNDLVRQRARAGHPEGLVILAEEQSAGRGRLGRSWVAGYGDALLLSALLRPVIPPSEAFSLTMLAAVALCEAVESVTPLEARLKWPNDLMLLIDGVWRKAAGILSELNVAGDAIEWAIVGIGLNVNQAPDGMVDGRDLRQVATCVSAAAGRRIARAPLLETLLLRLDQRYAQIQGGEYDAVYDAWRARLLRIGEQVTVQTPGGELHGIAEDVERDGSLVLRDHKGVTHTIHAGDVGF